MYRSRSPLLTAALVVASALTLASPATARPTAVASASYGRAVVTLEEDRLGSDDYRLTYQADADAPEKVVDVDLPTDMVARDQRVGLGLDATGLLTAVVQSPRGLFWLHVTRPAEGLRKLAHTSDSDAPAIYKGRVAYVCKGGTAICKASLRTKSRRVLLRESSGQWRFNDVRIGKNDALAVAGERDGALGASRIQVARRGTKPKTIADANLDGLESVHLADLSPASDHLNVIRRSYAADGDPQGTEDTLEVFTFPAGKPLT